MLINLFKKACVQIDPWNVLRGSKAANNFFSTLNCTENDKWIKKYFHQLASAVYREGTATLVEIWWILYILSQMKKTKSKNWKMNQNRFTKKCFVNDAGTYKSGASLIRA